MKEILVETSARHVHVTQETLEKLFGEGFQLEVRAMLSQPGQFATGGTPVPPTCASPTESAMGERASCPSRG